MVELGQFGRWGGGHSARFVIGQFVGSDQRDCSHARDKRRLYKRAGARASPSHPLFPCPLSRPNLALGEMAEALLLASARVEPKKLLASGYVFQTPTLRAVFDAL
jgi:hypothetical protein